MTIYIQYITKATEMFQCILVHVLLREFKLISKPAIYSIIYHSYLYNIIKTN